jgi:hypothetical protein
MCGGTHMTFETAGDRKKFISGVSYKLCSLTACLDLKSNNNTVVEIKGTYVFQRAFANDFVYGWC